MSLGRGVSMSSIMCSLFSYVWSLASSPIRPSFSFCRRDVCVSLYRSCVSSFVRSFVRYRVMYVVIGSCIMLCIVCVYAFRHVRLAALR